MSYKDQEMAQVAILAHQLKAARALAKLDQYELSARSGVSIPTIKRMESGDGPVRGNYDNVAAVVAALEASGVEFTNGGQPGVRLKAAGSIPIDKLNASNDE
jgi:transcriptional regulator with XRE-family HTH domain